MPAPKNTPLEQLKDLTPAERDQLRRALDGEEVSVNAEERAAQRDRLFGELIEPREHQRSCPTIGATPRVEVFGATAPADPALGLPKRAVTIVRCLECGGQVKLEEPYTAVLRRIHTEISEMAES